MWGIVFASLEWLGISPLTSISYLLGVDIAAVNLLFSLLMTYPLAIYYEKYFQDKSVDVKHWFFILSGLDIAYFNFGVACYHNFVAAFVFMSTLIIFGAGKTHTLVTFVFNMIYLLLGYYATESENYDVTWTMPHCILVLKLIGCAFDIWDGQIPEEKLSDMNKKTALKDPPTIMELLGFIYFPAAFLVGPQFSMKKYKDMVAGKFPTKTANPSNEEAALARGKVGILYLVMFQVGRSIFSQEKLMSDEFDEYSIIYKHIFLGFWGKFVLYKYLGCWLITEAACIRFGLAYEGEKDGKSLWNGCQNVKLVQLETASKFGHYIESFNVNTNHWVGQYIFRRLKFMGNKYLSQFCTLLFLALWHGLMSGYYMTFFMEYIIMFMEKELEPMLQQLKLYEKMWNSPLTKPIVWTVLKLYTVVFMGYCLVPFDLKLAYKWWHVYKSLYFSGFILFAPWAFVYKPILIYLIKNNFLY